MSLNQNSNNNPEKLEKITELLWKIWWGILYLIILPFTISGALYYIFIDYTFNISIFFIALPTTLLIFQLPFDKYRKNRFFTKSDLPSLKHLMIYFLISLSSIIFSFILWYTLTIFNINDQNFIHFSDTFLIFLHPILSIISITYYFVTRNFPKKDDKTYTVLATKYT